MILMSHSLDGCACEIWLLLRVFIYDERVIEVWVEVEACKLKYYIMRIQVGSKFYDMSYFQTGMWDQDP